MSLRDRLVRRHTCPACNKTWTCLAEAPTRNKNGRPSRPIVPCVYPVLLACPSCNQEIHGA